MKTPALSSDPLLELFDCLEQKGKFIEAFLTLTHSLRDRLVAEEWSGVEGLLKQRQDIIFKVDQLNVRLQALSSRQPLDPEQFPEARRKRVSELLNTINDVSESAQSADQECMDKLIRWRDQTRSNLSKMRGSFKAVHGYVQRPIRPPKFLDVRR